MFYLQAQEGVNLIASVSQAKICLILNSTHCLFICLIVYFDYECFVFVYLFFFWIRVRKLRCFWYFVQTGILFLCNYSSSRRVMFLSRWINYQKIYTNKTNQTLVIWVCTKSFVGKHPEAWALMALFCQIFFISEWPTKITCELIHDVKLRKDFILSLESVVGVNII